MPQIDIYTKQQVDAKIPSADELVPDTTGASVGDVLTVGASGTEWATPSAGVTRTKIDITSFQNLIDWLETCKEGDELFFNYFATSSTSSPVSLHRGHFSVESIYAENGINVQVQMVGACTPNRIGSNVSNGYCNQLFYIFSSNMTYPRISAQNVMYSTRQIYDGETASMSDFSFKTKVDVIENVAPSSTTPYFSNCFVIKYS